LALIWFSYLKMDFDLVTAKAYERTRCVTSLFNMRFARLSLKLRHRRSIQYGSLYIGFELFFFLSHPYPFLKCKLLFHSMTQDRYFLTKINKKLSHHLVERNGQLVDISSNTNRDRKMDVDIVFSVVMRVKLLFPFNRLRMNIWTFQTNKLNNNNYNLFFMKNIDFFHVIGLPFHIQFKSHCFGIIEKKNKLNNTDARASWKTMEKNVNWHSGQK